MNGQDHFARAERLLETVVAMGMASSAGVYPDLREEFIARAHVHATLALVAVLADVGEVGAGDITPRAAAAIAELALLDQQARGFSAETIERAMDDGPLG